MSGEKVGVMAVGWGGQAASDVLGVNIGRRAQKPAGGSEEGEVQKEEDWIDSDQPPVSPVKEHWNWSRDRQAFFRR